MKSVELVIECPDCQGEGSKVKVGASPWPVFCQRCNGTGKAPAIATSEGIIPKPLPPIVGPVEPA
jgi:DnaJ-class molecular chaperone